MHCDGRKSLPILHHNAPLKSLDLVISSQFENRIQLKHTVKKPVDFTVKYRAYSTVQCMVGMLQHLITAHEQTQIYRVFCFHISNTLLASRRCAFRNSYYSIDNRVLQNTPLSFSHSFCKYYYHYYNYYYYYNYNNYCHTRD